MRGILLIMKEDIISWSAPQYEHREHPTDWYWAIGIVTVSLAVAFIIVGNTLLSLVLLLGMGTLLLYQKHPPHIIDCAISKKGIHQGKTLHPWESIASFWVLEGLNDVKYHRDPKILITSKKPLMPHIVIPLTDEVIDDVHEILVSRLHEEHQIEPLPERLMRKIGF